MEVIRLSGYSEEEKHQIARRYLLPRVLQDSGLRADSLLLSDDTLQHLIARYTREAGVRELERVLARLVRKLALRIAEGAGSDAAQLNTSEAVELLGAERFLPESARSESQPGVATGLAWTEVGGDVLYVESIRLPAGRGLTLTGQLGEVMKESAQAAQSYILSRAHSFGLPDKLARSEGVHIHVPAGAIPKDGPSAGVTMATSLLSAYTGLSARNDLAMTGEITLTGLVLPVGGIKEKVLAARRAGIHSVILPKDNQRDLKELPDNVRAEMQFHPVSHLDEVFALALPELERRGLNLVQVRAS